MIEAVAYFYGPETSWSGKLSEREIIARRSFRWLWLARWWLKSVTAPLDPERCGCAILKNGAVILQVDPA